MAAELLPKNAVGLQVQIDDETVWLVFAPPGGLTAMINVASLADNQGGGVIKSAIDAFFNQCVDETRKKIKAVDKNQEFAGMEHGPDVLCSWVVLKTLVDLADGAATHPAERTRAAAKITRSWMKAAEEAG